MKTTLQSIVLLACCSLTILVGCRKVDPELEPIVSEVVTGQVGDSMVVYNAYGLGIHLEGGNGFPSNIFEYALDADGNITLLFGTNYSHNGWDSYSSANVGGTVGVVQLATITLNDTIMECDDRPNSVTYFNIMAPRPCDGQLNFISASSFEAPRRYPANTLVDENLSWGASNGTFSAYSSWLQSDTISIRHYHHNNLWDGYTGAGNYLAFRWSDGPDWKYGYVEMTASTSTIHITRIVRER